MINFELAHIWIFFVGCLYSIQAFILSIVLRSIKRNWDRMEQLSHADINEFESFQTSAPSNLGFKSACRRKRSCCEKTSHADLRM